MSRNAINIFLIILIVVAGFGGYMLYQDLQESEQDRIERDDSDEDGGDEVNEQDENAPDEDVAPSDEPGPKGEWQKYSSEEGKFTFEFPTDIFRLDDVQDGFQLRSSQYVYDLRGEGDDKYYFSMNFNYEAGGMLEVMKSYLGEDFEEVFPGGTLASFKVTPGFSMNFDEGGRPGYAVTMGVEGYYKRYGFLPINKQKTLVIEFNYYDNEAFGRTEDDYNLEQQMQIFYSILDTLKFEPTSFSS